MWVWVFVFVCRTRLYVRPFMRTRLRTTGANAMEFDWNANYKIIYQIMKIVLIWVTKTCCAVLVAVSSLFVITTTTPNERTMCAGPKTTLSCSCSAAAVALRMPLSSFHFVCHSYQHRLLWRRTHTTPAKCKHTAHTSWRTRTPALNNGCRLLLLLLICPPLLRASCPIWGDATRITSLHLHHTNSHHNLTYISYSLKFAKMQIEREETNGHGNADRCYRCDCVEGGRCDGGHAQFEYSLGNRHLATLPFDWHAFGTVKVQMHVRRIEQGHRSEFTILHLIEGRCTDAISTAEWHRTLQ